MARTPTFGPLVVHAAVAVIVALAGAAGLYLFLAWLLDIGWRPNAPTADQQKLLADLVKIALGLAAGVGAAIALVVGYRRSLVDEAASHRDDRRLYSSRYQDAAHLIGHDKVAVRLAGIYAIAKLADDWKEQRQQCIDVLCAYVRLPYDPAAGEPGEREVRRAVIRLITAHLQSTTLYSWHGRRFDLTEAVIDGGDFRNASFGRADFSGAQFSGRVDFSDASFHDPVDFSGAQFTNATVDFTDTRFLSGLINFRDAQFTGSTVDFTDAELSGGIIDFTGASLTGGLVDLSEAHLHPKGQPPVGLPESPRPELKLPDWMRQTSPGDGQ